MKKLLNILLFGCWGALEVSGTVELCDSFSTSTFPNYYCTFEVCGNTTVTLSGCPEDGGSCNGETLFALFDENGYSVPTTSSACGSCARMILTHDTDEDCSLFNLHQRCASGYCGGTTAVVNAQINREAAQQLALLNWWFYVGNNVPIAEHFGWDMSTPLNDWQGIGTDGYGNVTILENFWSMFGWWTGEAYLSDDTFANLPHLTVLNLNGVITYGTVPAYFSTFTDLQELYLKAYQLHGPMPVLPESLEYVTIRQTSLTGPVPAIPDSVYYCDISFNYLTGTLSTIDSASLEYFLGLYNYISGSIPEIVSAYLSNIDVGANYIVGTIPSPPDSVIEYQFYYNLLTGTLPQFSWELIHLGVANNFLSGTLPAIIPMSGFRLSCSSNYFTGTLPQSLSDYGWLVADNNLFTGPLPELTETMNILDVHNNILTGTVPEVYFDVLQWFDISFNSAITGIIPEAVCNITALQSFRALGCSVSCYYPCYPTNAYIDYMTPYSMQFDTVVPNYNVCENPEIEALCKLDQSLGISASVPSASNREYLAESMELAAVPYFTTQTGAVLYFEYDFSDPTDQFSRFEIIFNQRSVSLVSESQEMYVYCFADGYWQTYHFLGYMPGEGSELPFSKYCPQLEIKLLLVSAGYKLSQLGSYFTVNRFAYSREWNCTNSTYRTNPCQWYGIGCSDNAAVSSISLSGMFLENRLPSSIGDLKFLKSLDLSTNSITGVVPATLLLAKDTLEMMDISNNAFSSIPNEIGLLTNLKYLYLSANDFSGTLPTFLAALTQLEELQFRSNGFSGSFPAVFCNMSSTTQISAQGNQFLCSSECPSVYLGGCTLQTSNGDQSLSTSGKVGVALGVGVVVAILFFRGRKRYKQHAQYKDLPLHRRILKKMSISESDVIAHQGSLHRLDMHGNSILDFIYEPNMKRVELISEDALFFIVMHSLHFNVETGSLIENEAEHNFAWSRMVQQSDDKSFSVVRRVLEQADDHIDHLVNSCDRLGRHCVDVACSRVREELRFCTFLDRRFEMKAGPPEHKSATSVVVFAVDHSQVTEPHVALKFMRNRHQYLSEIAVRKSGDFDASFVIDVLDHFDGDDLSEKNISFRKAAIKRSFKDYPYCLVMTLADMNIDQVIDKSYIVGKDWDAIKHILKTLCNCLTHIHEKGVIHGDIKPMNMMMVNNAVRLIDFDASLRFGSSDAVDYAGGKYSSGYLPPEMFIDNGKRVKRFDIDENGNRVGVRYVTKDDNTTDLAIHLAGYHLVEASPSLDMWAVGVVLYHLCTGYPLFLTSFEGNVMEREAKNICNWSMSLKEEKLAAITDKYARNLVSLLLSKDPAMRPSAERVLCHPFITGNSPIRMQGEEPEYDIFISYRVASDASHAETLYQALTEHGLKVWWDRKCLLPGQPWEEGFCSGLVNSSCFVCLLSRGAINHPSKPNNNFTTYNEQSPCDNVLLEWRLALELRMRNMIEGILPIMIGDVVPDVVDPETGSKVYSDYNHGCHPHPLPTLVVRAVEEKMISHLERQGLGLPLHDTMTVQEIVKEIIANQGAHIRKDFTVSFGKVCDAVVKMRQAITVNKTRIYEEDEHNCNSSRRLSSSHSPWRESPWREYGGTFSLRVTTPVIGSDPV